MATTVNKVPLYKALKLSNAKHSPKLKFKKSIDYDMAKAMAILMTDITGDMVRLTGGNRGWFVERWTGSEWVKG